MHPFRILLPDGVEQRVHGTRVDVYHDGVMVDSTEIGWLRRTLLRIWRAWKLRSAAKGTSD